VRSRRRLAIVALLGAVVLVAGCGARLSPKQRSLAIQQGGGGTGVGTTTTQSQAPTGTATTGPTGTGTTGTGNGGTAGTKGTAGTTTTTGGGAGPTGASCKATSANNGGKTDTGVSATTINLANVSDISGPVPGLFKSAREAAQAYVNYFNATFPSGICGRKLALDTYDSRTDSTSNRNATAQACSKDFAITGSQSAFDDGGAAPVNSCKDVDIPAAAVTTQLQSSPYVHAALSTDAHHISDVTPNFVASEKNSAAFLYINAGASAQNGQHDIAAYQKAWGTKFKFTAAVPIQNATTQGFGPYVRQMKSKGVTFVQWLGAYQEAASLAQAMDSASFYPKYFLMDPTAYNSAYLQQAGSVAEKVHSYIYSPATVIHSSDPEEQLYESWLTRSGISSEPTFFGQCSWSAMELFVQMAFKVGPKLTRASMNQALSKVQNWTGNGITSKQNVGSKITGAGALFLKDQGGQWVKAAPTSGDYIYGKLVAT
jgi:hypothetical protein